MKLKKLFIVCATVAFVLSFQLNKQYLVAQTSNKVEINFDFERVMKIASNQFAVWIEDENGRFIKTLYVTKFTATGGYEKRPDSLLKWADVHTKKNVDSITKSTPSSSKITCTWDFTDSNSNPVSRDKEYMFFVEGTTSWKDNVLYSGTINPKSKGSIKVNVVYSTANARKSDMIKNVSASYE